VPRGRRLAEAEAWLQPQTAHEVVLAACHGVLLDAGLAAVSTSVTAPRPCGGTESDGWHPQDPSTAAAAAWRERAPVQYRLTYTVPVPVPVPVPVVVDVQASASGGTVVMAAAVRGCEREGVATALLPVAWYLRLDVPLARTRMQQDRTGNMAWAVNSPVQRVAANEVLRGADDLAYAVREQVAVPTLIRAWRSEGLVYPHSLDGLHEDVLVRPQSACAAPPALA
jgi:hypothetical protein